jgi:Uma2 family endonuclease
VSTQVGYTSADLARFPEDGLRREIIRGKLYLSTQPHLAHQILGNLIGHLLETWNEQLGHGFVATAPGLVFAEDDDVVPDLVWVSRRRLAETLGPDGHLHGPSELVVEGLSPGAANERRDREAKRRLYDRRGGGRVLDRRLARPHRQGLPPRRPGTGALPDPCRRRPLTSPLLPGFVIPASRLFADLPG